MFPHGLAGDAMCPRTCRPTVNLTHSPVDFAVRERGARVGGHVSFQATRRRMWTNLLSRTQAADPLLNL
jgi:hypothetical protein